MSSSAVDRIFSAAEMEITYKVISPTHKSKNESEVIFEWE